MGINLTSYATGLVVWITSLVIVAFSTKIIPTIYRNITTTGLSRAWKSADRNWYFYYLSFWEDPPSQPKGGRLRVRGLYPFSFRASLEGIDQPGTLSVRTYPKGFIRVSATHLNFVIKCDDPDAHFCMVFRMPPTSFERGYLVGTTSSITLTGDPCAGACILSTHRMTPDEITPILERYKNIKIGTESACHFEWRDPHARKNEG